jgi:spermidine synthase
LRWERVATASVPSGGQLELLRRGDEFAILVDGRQLMGSRVHASEDALGEIACDALPSDARLLIGGLGMGFTLGAALRRLGPEARVTVAELSADVVRWNRELLGQLAGSPLDDPRVEVFTGDVADCVRAKGPWDGILLDVDNGPDGLTQPSNAWLYGVDGLRAARASLRPGGVLCVWSAGPNAAFEGRLPRAGLRGEVRALRERAGRGARHVVWICRAIPFGGS